MSTVRAAGTSGPGRTRITSRALNRVVSAVTSEELGVDTRAVGVDLEDSGGSLTLTVRAPIHVISIQRAQNDPHAVERGGGSVLERANRAQANIRRRVHDLTGSDIAQVVLRLTRADIKQEKRVR